MYNVQYLKVRLMYKPVGNPNQKDTITEHSGKERECRMDKIRKIETNR